MSFHAYPLFYQKGEILNIKQTLLSNIKEGAFPLFTCEQIARAIHVGRVESFALKKILLTLVREGELLTDSLGRFGTKEQFGALTGTITGNERGFGFFTPEGGTEDLFIPHRALNGAIHGDIVLAIKTGGRSDDEGEVLAVIAHGIKEVVGTYHRARRAGYLDPDDKRFDREIFIPFAKNSGCRNGAKAVAKITSFEGRTPTGEIVEILGTSGELFTEEAALIRGRGLKEEFPEEVLAAAERAASRGAEDTEGREDLRGELIVTVDGEDTRDIDDAISVEKMGDKFELGVHIADVSHYVGRNSPLDREAFARGTSVYFPDRVLPMLPPALSNGICSLNEGVDRLTLSCIMTVDGDGKVLGKKLLPSVIRSRHRMTYTEIMQLYVRRAESVRKYPGLLPFVDTAMELTNILKRARAERGGLSLDTKEVKIIYDQGKISLPDEGRTLAHEMIECFMVLANESVAEMMEEMDAPFIYRIHEKPSAEKATSFKEYLDGIGIPAKFHAENVKPCDYQNILTPLEGSPLLPIVNRVMLRSMMKARYSPENVGHFGLASKSYCHFTSPIRRYPDLCIHRIIKGMLKDGAATRAQYKSFVKEASVQSSMCERNAQDAERDADDLYIAEYMRDKVGEEYDAVLSGVTSFGLFAELKNGVEGFIPLETLPFDRYEFEEEHFLLTGNKHIYHLGQAVKVKVAHADLSSRRVQFVLI